MNYRIAKKIVTCKSTLSEDYHKVMQARKVIEASGKPGWLFLSMTEEHFYNMQRYFKRYVK